MKIIQGDVELQWINVTQSVLFFGLALGVLPALADERAPSAGSTARRAVSARPDQVAGPGTTRSAEAVRAPVQVAQIDSHGRYPFGQFRGGYRYPFSYPYYRYGATRHYPYSFGVGPYGPYGSNYGGYSGNAYDPRPPAGGPPLSDAPPAPPPADPAPPARAPQNNPPALEDGPDPRVPARPVPDKAQTNGDPVPMFNGNSSNPGYATPQTFWGYPNRCYDDDVWFGQNGAALGFGQYPAQVYPYQFGPPSGPGNFSPQDSPRYYNFNTRNYGPAYPYLGGINGGPGYYQGW